MRARFAVFALLAACGTAAIGEMEIPDPVDLATNSELVAESVAGLVAGEVMRFDVKIAGVLAGEAQFAVGEPGKFDGVDAIAVSSRITSAGALALLKEVRDEATSMVNLATLTPIRTTSDFLFGDKRYHADTTYQNHVATIRYQSQGSVANTFTYAFGDSAVHDAHTAMAQVRTWQAAKGDRMELWMIGGRRIWHTEISFGAPEVIGTRLGNQAAIRIDGTSRRTRPDRTPDLTKPPRRFSAWLSDDADRVPLLVTADTEYGALTIELVDYQRP